MASSGRSLTTYLRASEAKRFEEAVKVSGKSAYALAADLISIGLDALEPEKLEGKPKRRRRARRGTPA